MTVYENVHEVTKLLTRAIKLLEAVNQDKKSYTKTYEKTNNSFTSNGEELFDIKSMRWLTGKGQDRKTADIDEPLSYLFVTDRNGEIYPEVKPLYDEVCRYGIVHTQGWEIYPFGTRVKMLGKRKPRQ
jgi:hypothetical protein